MMGRRAAAQGREESTARPGQKGGGGHGAEDTGSQAFSCVCPGEGRRAGGNLPSQGRHDPRTELTPQGRKKFQGDSGGQW